MAGCLQQPGEGPVLPSHCVFPPWLCLFFPSLCLFPLSALYLQPPRVAAGPCPEPSFGFASAEETQPLSLLL